MIITKAYFCIVVFSIRDHYFDSKERRRVVGKNRVGTVSTKRNDTEKGTLGVRWEKARPYLSKMLPTKIMGISDDEANSKMQN